MRIDAYTHFIPEKFFAKLVESGYPDIGKRMREIPCIHDLDIRKKVVEQFDDYAQILSYPMPPLELLGKGAQIEDYAKAVNDGFADIVAKTAIIFPAGWRKPRSARPMPACAKPRVRLQTARSACRSTPTSPAGRSTTRPSRRSSKR